MRRYETFFKSKGKFNFMGWYSMMSEDFCISTKQRKDREGKVWTYKTYKYLNGTVEEYKYGAYVD